MKLHPSELFIIYDPTNTYGRRTLAYAHSHTSHVQSHDVMKEKFTTTHWGEILDRLGLRAKDLLNRAHQDYQRTIAGGNYGDDDWLTILTHNPHLIRYPIALKGQNAVLCKSPTDIFKLPDVTPDPRQVTNV